MAENKEAQRKAKAAAVARARYRDYLEKRIPELHKQGVAGRKARAQADQEYAAERRRSQLPHGHATYGGTNG